MAVDESVRPSVSPTGVGALRTPGDAGSPLSWFQERLWVHHRRSPGTTSYNLPLPLLVHGDLDVDALERSLDLVVARHESLRTTYGETAAGEARQLVAPPGRVRLPVVDVDRAGMLEHLDRLLEHRFDLHRGPICIARLLRLASDRHLLLFSVHHIAADAWSLKAILLAELQDAYAAFCRGEQPDLPPLTVQYQDYARMQRTADLTDDLAYWRETLAGYEDSLELPTVRTRQLRSGTTSGTVVHRYPQAFSQELERFSRRHGCTLFMSLLAGLGVTLSRYTDKTDLCLGTTTSDRPDVALEPLIGFFVNILPLRLRIDEHGTVSGLLEAVRAQVLGAFEHPVPFEQILQATDVARRGSANPLVPVVIRHQNFPETSLDAPLPGGVTFRAFPEPGETDEDVLTLLAQEHAPARCEIELSYTGDADGLEVEVVYASDLYDRQAVERLLAHHQQVLEGMVADADRRVLDLPLLRDADVAELLGRSDRARVTEAPAWTFVERFDAQVALAPDAPACWDSRGAWTYREVALRSGRVAHALAARGTAPGDVVAVCLPRGGDLLATLLGVWRAGAAYVPLDPAYPAAYLQQILDDARPGVVVCDAAHQAALGIDDAACVRVDQVDDAGPDTPDAPRAHPAPPDALAYVMYTSGSTGTPKGVRVPHRQLVNWLSSLEASLPFEPGEVVGQKTTFAFAVGVKELFAGLLNGCPQAVIDNATVRDTAAFVEALAEHRVSRLNIVPSHLASVVEHLAATGRRLPALRICITAGEPLPRALVLAAREVLPDARLINNYGCTELNDVTYHDTSSLDGQSEFVPIGTPIANTRLYVLDRHGRLVPDGVPGELHVASVGLPEGYHGLDALTAERFTPNPFGSTPSDRLYNTGDVVRYLPDGTLDFIGRWDFQIKVRGSRLDVRHVEEVMSGFPGVRARAVVGRGDRLVAFFTHRPDQPVDVAELRAFLQDRLPAFMVPDAFVLLDSMPLLPNGKLDRRALHEAQGELQQSGAYEAPATATERTLADIWGLVVNVPAARIGRATHFFEIGGHSLAAMRVLARTKDEFGIAIGLAELFDSPRLHSLAAVIDREIARLPVGARGASSAPTAARTSKPRAADSGLLRGKVVLVTGGSRGIGLATALLLAEQGATVAINYRDSEAQARHVKGLIEADGGTAEVFGADVTRADDVADMVAAVHGRFERVDVLVANAHMHFRHAPFLGYDWADLERKVGNELKAVFHPCQAVAPEMVRRGSGSIIAVSSTLSKRSSEGFLAQSTAKAAVDAFVRSIATELGPHGIRANTVAPGLTLTDAAMPMAPHVKESIAARSPMRRNALPADMAGAVVFLASDLSRFMTGTYLPVDGGFTTL
ncbi:hybrid non-ribosomal peptide synthetase/SDR family oxidoreductase [Cellulomonas sp. S1-8]|uniref:hybrid non-ribosomal peptide synthetase/SDR family oxidoreductase n=1 Tax=Cellulomonas sp. S1-8 TaxID=2904790 RepID=UPI002243AE08|nr:amino acid adenylation domain-containing protein [Cellulomonas sp. S1-8]UZN03730.1 amino acid adenylation domain-containing protein [Cellulomonas sp. S1-8]